MSDNCYYIKANTADGKPVDIDYHYIFEELIDENANETQKPTFETKCLSVPRSKAAQQNHSIGRMVKLITLISGFTLPFILSDEIYDFGVGSSVFLWTLSGGSGVYLFYFANKTRPKWFAEKQYPESKELLRSGYEYGKSPIYSHFPNKFIYNLIRIFY